jgi:hypothetical protein
MNISLQFLSIELQMEVSPQQLQLQASEVLAPCVLLPLLFAVQETYDTKTGFIRVRVRNYSVLFLEFPELFKFSKAEYEGSTSLLIARSLSCPEATVMEDVTLETSMGTIVCEMYYDHAPRTCKNFVELVRHHQEDTDKIGKTRILQRNNRTSSSSVTNSSSIA